MRRFRLAAALLSFGILVWGEAVADARANVGLTVSNALTTNNGPYNMGGTLEGYVRFERLFGAGGRLFYHLLDDGANWISIQFLGDFHLLDPESTSDVYIGGALGDGFVHGETTLDLVARTGWDCWFTEHVALNVEGDYFMAIGFSDATVTTPTGQKIKAPPTHAVRLRAGVLNVGLRFRF